MTVFFPQGIGQVAEVLISIKRLQVIYIFFFVSFTSQIQVCSYFCRHKAGTMVQTLYYTNHFYNFTQTYISRIM